jgi:hypothetical protein
MVVHGEGDDAKEEARRQEQPYASSDTRTATILGLLGRFHNDYVFMALVQ